MVSLELEYTHHYGLACSKENLVFSPNRVVE